ncbi:FHA domain-containing protein [Acinetobacter zhairhuonensis]|uniref:FHA domain-containing protein n=1 Tax=Acinetobacter sp. A7.4 TaxID=2919921 RepID=UPI001F503D79|nr:FHA domain-containing protein [Acinetobacter sp. A7.4]MCJ8162556.1 FHA domain-containing protein [Acinetobacter sp. A7.4]
MTWKIQAITGEFTGQEISIDHDMLVGRHQEADVLLQSAEVSRKHAALLLKEQALWVQDLNSSNGTFVNDLKVENESQLHDGDIVQFASFKFSVLAPAQMAEVVETETETETVAVQQPAEAVAPSETAAEKTVAEQMNDQGMPSLTERDSNVQLSRDGMPQSVAVPKPAPIPEGVDVSKVTPNPEPVPVEQPVSRVEEEHTQQKNASLGLITIIVLVILAILAWVMFK